MSRVIGLVWIALAIWRWRSTRVPAGSTRFTGTVVEEVVRRSSLSGKPSRLYAPRVRYQHPRTGADETFEPRSFNGERFDVGAPAQLYHDPRTDSVRRPPYRPLRSAAITTAVGVALIVAPFFAR